MSPRILILTAGFGDGHNAAAANLAYALPLLDPNSSVEVADLFHESSASLNAFFRFVYRNTTTFFPGSWRRLYNLASSPGFSSLTAKGALSLKSRIAAKLNRFQPHAIVSTYPFYPTLLASTPRLAQGHSRPLLATVITDSISIHPLWLQGLTDRFYVSDPMTESLVSESLGSSHSASVKNLGFPSPPSLEALSRVRSPNTVPNSSLRVLFFPTRSRSQVSLQIETIARTIGSEAQLTVVLGRHERRLRPAVEPLIRSQSRSFPRTSLLGWIPDAWQLMLEHDLVISKAGGATVHEAIATHTPIIIDKVVPGQEEGNASLVNQADVGLVAKDQRSLRQSLEKIRGTYLSPGCMLTRFEKNLTKLSPPRAAENIARDLLASLPTEP